MSIAWHDEVESTQDLAHELAERGAPHGTAVAARRQRAGRGSRGRPWASGAGGLWLSVVGRPDRAESVATLSLRVGLEVAAAVEAVAGLATGAVRLKWPNDLIVQDRKLGGILCEARWRGEMPEWVAVGVGINVANHLDPALASAAYRLADLGGRVDPETLAPPVVDAVCRALAGTGTLTPEELASYAGRDWLVGHRVGGRHEGVVQGISFRGSLLVQGPDGLLFEVSDALASSDLAPSQPGR